MNNWNREIENHPEHLWKVTTSENIAVLFPDRKVMKVFVTLKTNEKWYNMYAVRMKTQETILGWNEEKSWYRRHCEESKSHNFLSRFSKAEFLTGASRQHVASLAEETQGIAIRRKTILNTIFNSSVQFSWSVVSNSLWPHEPQHARPPCHHQLLEFTQTHVHQVGDAVQLSHPLLSPSPPVLNLSWHQSLFQWVNSLHEVAKVLEFQL